ncbi:MAG: family 16 glycosylhydrolase [Oligoflexales bacterium]|nr:family 16 glycosylhydrolase [Oligoflexales bacterium]
MRIISRHSFYLSTVVFLYLSSLPSAHGGQFSEKWWDPMENLDNWTKSSGWSNGNVFGCTWNASNVETVWNSAVRLTVNSQNKTDYCGEIKTSRKFGYGFYEVNMMAQTKAGIITGFFIYTGPSYGTAWNEIDIEILGSRKIDGKPAVQFNYAHDGVGGHEYVYGLDFDPASGFHKYGFDWQPDHIAWYIDGAEVYRVAGEVPKTPSFIWINQWNFAGEGNWWSGGSWDHSPAFSWFDYVQFIPKQ